MHYRIRIKGHLDQSWQEWLERLQIAHESDGTSVLQGALPDQPALYGVLAKLGHLGLTLLTLESGAMMEGSGRGPPQHAAFATNPVYSTRQPNDDTQPTI